MKKFLDTFLTTIAILFAVLLTFGVVGVLGLPVLKQLGLVSGLLHKQQPETIPVNIDSVISDISEIAFVKDDFTSYYSYEEDGILCFTGKSILLTYDGYVKAGIDDFHGVVYDVDPDEKVIVVKYPDPVVLGDVYIDPDSITAVNVEEGLFDKFEFEDMTDFICEFQEVELENALNDGILEEAKRSIYDQTISMVTDELKDMGYGDYKVYVSFNDHMYGEVPGASQANREEGMR